MNTKVLVVLGSPNSPTGILSDISKSRLDYCVKLYDEGDSVLCTGGWGPQFNTTKQPHASYAKTYLIKQGVLEQDFLDLALSSNTVDDAVKLLPIIQNLKNINLTIITSDYHLERVTLIFNEILKEYPLEYIGVPSHLEETDYTLLVNHEKKAVQSIIKNGLYY